MPGIYQPGVCNQCHAADFDNQHCHSLEPEPDSRLYSFFPLLFLLLVSSLGISLGVLSILLLLAGSALVSGSEVAFFSLTANEFEKLEQEIASLEEKLASGDADAEKVTAWGSRHVEASRELEVAMERWLELEEMQRQIRAMR